MNKVISIIIISAALLFGQDFQGTKIYINPGHGGNDPANDRYIPQTGFWESEGNLTKGLYLRDLLESHNAVVFMSRTQNREEDDLPLSQIDQDANANNVDFFHSIHSNGFKGNANYTLMLYKETGGAPVDPLSRTMCTIMDDKIYNVLRTTAAYTRGDQSFLGFNLGVLNYLNYSIMHGTLSEGSFHDYIPESWRLMSIDYRKHESIAILRAFIDFYDLDPLPDGVVAGIVRDKNAEVDYSYSYISALPNDKKKTVNNAKVTLLPDNRVYNVDFNNNGFYMFENVEPGEYQVVMEGGNYKADTVNVTAVAHKTVFADGFLDRVENKPPEVYGSVPVANAMGISTYQTIELRFSKSMNQSSVQDAFSIVPAVGGAFQWSNNNLNMAYVLNDSLARLTGYTITLAAGAESAAGVALEADFQFNFTTSEDHVHPEIVDYYPGANLDSVKIDDEIRITFDTEMRQMETETAFSIDPHADGSFQWNEDNTKLTFIPDGDLQKETLYTVTFSKEAQNKYGVSLDSTFMFTFHTRRINNLLVKSTFPAQNQTDISTKMQFYIVFHDVIQLNSVVGNFEIKDDAGNFNGYRSLNAFEKDGRGVLVMEPRPEFNKNTNYYISLFPGIKDQNGLTLADTLTIHFKTVEEVYDSGNIVDDFETLFGWVDPDNNPTTKGTDARNTYFAQSSFKQISDTYSGKLEYIFVSDTGGVCHLKNEEGLSIANNPDSEFGLWIFGDYSQNLLEFGFNVGSGINKTITIDTIKWAGWKLITIPTAMIAESGGIIFHSLYIRQLAEGDTSGTLYIDDVQYDITYTDITDKYAETKVPEKIELYQNYPNPFNPGTVIRYALPSAGQVEITIFNNLGQKITTLFSERQQAGMHEVEWQAANMASGVYYYSIKTADTYQVRKMVLLK